MAKSDDPAQPQSQVFVPTVTGNMEGFSKREIKRAHEAKRFHGICGRPCIDEFTKIINTGAVQNCSVTVRDVAVAVAIWGPEFGARVDTVIPQPQATSGDVIKTVAWIAGGGGANDSADSVKKQDPEKFEITPSLDDKEAGSEAGDPEGPAVNFPTEVLVGECVEKWRCKSMQRQPVRMDPDGHAQKKSVMCDLFGHETNMPDGKTKRYTAQMAGVAEENKINAFAQHSEQKRFCEIWL